MLVRRKWLIPLSIDQIDDSSRQPYIVAVRNQWSNWFAFTRSAPQQLQRYEGTMAKKKSATSAGGKLQGKTVAFVGKFGYTDMFRAQFAQLVVREGGTVVEPSQTVPDYLFVGEGRGGKPQIGRAHV